MQSDQKVKTPLVSLVIAKKNENSFFLSEKLECPQGNFFFLSFFKNQKNIIDFFKMATII